MDNRAQPFEQVGSFLAVDMIAQLRSRTAVGMLKDVALTLSMLNVFNEKPSRIRSNSSADPSYDSTNYPATGRAVSLTISKSW